jgi:hypothetical protein
MFAFNLQGFYRICVSILVTDSVERSCRHYALRVCCSCTVHNVRVKGPGFLSLEKWQYLHYGIIEVAGPPEHGATIAVHLSNVHVREVVHSNGFRFQGAVRVTMQGCKATSCRRNGAIARVQPLQPACNLLLVAQAVVPAASGIQSVAPLHSKALTGMAAQLPLVVLVVSRAPLFT